MPYVPLLAYDKNCCAVMTSMSVTARAITPYQSTLYIGLSYSYFNPCAIFFQVLFFAICGILFFFYFLTVYVLLWLLFPAASFA